jgi:hypothetical protein
MTRGQKGKGVEKMDKAGVGGSVKFKREEILKGNRKISRKEEVGSRMKIFRNVGADRLVGATGQREGLDGKVFRNG